MLDSNTFNIIDWLSQHIALIGWPTLILLCWKARGLFDKFFIGVEEARDKAAETATIAADIRAGVDNVRDNHLAHLQTEINTMVKTQEKSNEILGSIDKNMGILVDRR